MTSGALVVIGLLVGLYVGARWARASRAYADLRTARANLTKAVNARRSAALGFALAVLVAVALLLLYIISMAAMVLPEEPYQQ